MKFKLAFKNLMTDHFNHIESYRNPMYSSLYQLMANLALSKYTLTHISAPPGLFSSKSQTSYHSICQYLSILLAF